jgi:hypothetical protein
MVPFWMVFFTAVVGGLFGGMFFFFWYLVYDASRGCCREKRLELTPDMEARLRLGSVKR